MRRFRFWSCDPPPMPQLSEPTTWEVPASMLPDPDKSKAEVKCSEEIWKDYFGCALQWMTGEHVSSQKEVIEIVDRAALMADRALDKLQERWPK